VGWLYWNHSLVFQNQPLFFKIKRVYNQQPIIKNRKKRKKRKKWRKSEILLWEKRKNTTNGKSNCCRQIYSSSSWNICHPIIEKQLDVIERLEFNTNNKFRAWKLQQNHSKLNQLILPNKYQQSIPKSIRKGLVMEAQWKRSDVALFSNFQYNFWYCY
jgi:hypothetical protein